MTRGEDALPLPFPAPRLASRITDMEHPDLLVDLRLEILDSNFITVQRRRIFETIELYHHKAPTLRLASHITWTNVRSASETGSIAAPQRTAG
jgi:hypothetical protein